MQGGRLGQVSIVSHSDVRPKPLTAFQLCCLGSASVCNMSVIANGDWNKGAAMGEMDPGAV